LAPFSGPLCGQAAGASNAKASKRMAAAFLTVSSLQKRGGHASKECIVRNESWRENLSMKTPLGECFIVFLPQSITSALIGTSNLYHAASGT
jgi:hypothetical protein